MTLSIIKYVTAALTAFLLLGMGTPLVLSQTVTIQKPTETILLYEKTSASESVPVITCLDMEKDGPLLAIGGDDHRVRVWNRQTGQFIMDMDEHLDWVRGLAFSPVSHPQRHLLGTVGQNGQIALWNIKSGKRHLTLKSPQRSSLHQLAFHPDGNRFAVTGFNAEVYLFSVDSGKLLLTLPTPSTNNRALAFSPDGQLLAVAGRNGVVRIWRVEKGEKLIDLSGDGRQVHALAFNADGKTLAVAGEGPCIMLFEPMSGKRIQTLPERPGKTYSLAFCGNDILASGESDNAIRLWNVGNNFSEGVSKTRRQVAALLGHTGTVSCLIYDSKNKTLISGSFDTSIRFWKLDMETTTITH